MITIDDCTAIDVRDLLRSGRKRPGDPMHQAWVGGELGTITWALDGPRVVVSYSRDLAGNDRWSASEAVIFLVREGMPRRGGVRTWFRCPSCNRRVARVLVLPGEADLRCRRCAGLLYRNQRSRVAAFAQRLDRYKELERRLEEPGLGFRTALRLSDQADALLARILREFDTASPLARLQRAMRKLNEPKYQDSTSDQPARNDRPALIGPTSTPATAAIRRRRGRPHSKRAYTRLRPYAAATPSAEDRGFCPRCRDRSRLLDASLTTYRNGRRALVGRCAVCGSRGSRILGMS